MSGREREGLPAQASAEPALPGAGPGPVGPAELAGQVGNRAFSRSVMVRQQPAEPTVQRVLIPMALIGAGLIYVSGEQRGWWGGDQKDVAAKTAGGADRLTKVKDQRAANLRSRVTLNNQVLGVLPDLARLVEKGDREGALKAKNNAAPLFSVFEGLAVGEGQRAQADAARDTFGEALQTAAALTETRAESIAMATTQFSGAVTAINGVVSGGSAPAQAPAPGPAPAQAPAPGPAPAQAPAPGPTPAPAPAAGTTPDVPPAGPPKPPIPPDVLASLKGVTESLVQAQADLAELREKGEPRDVIEFTEGIQPQLDALSGSFVGEDATKIQTAGFTVRNGIRHLQAMLRTREENGAHAAEAFRRCRTQFEGVFQGLLEADKLLDQEEKALEAEKAGAGEEGPPPKEGRG